MKTLRIQDKYAEDVFYLAFKALKHELGYLQKIKDEFEGETYHTPLKESIFVTCDKIENADYKIICKIDEETTIFYARYI